MPPKRPKHLIRPRGGKQPKTAISLPKPSKSPRSIEPTSAYQLRPSWRVGSMEILDRFGWHTLEEEKLKEIHSKLAAFETMSWSDILLVAKKRNHSIPVPALIAHAQRWLDHRKILLEEIISLRLSGEERVWGYLAEGGVFVLLWWDPLHEIFPSVLKHT